MPDRHPAACAGGSAVRAAYQQSDVVICHTHNIYQHYAETIKNNLLLNKI
jgi:hypothetical protein